MINAALGLSMLAAQTFAADCISSSPYIETYGYSSEESFGGGSYLGVDTRDITPERMSALKLKEERGVEVTMVDQDAPAGKAGIKEHDVILSVNDTPVESVEQLRRLIREVPPGRTVSVGISRDGQPMTLKAQLADRKQAFVFTGPEARTFTVHVPKIEPMPIMPDIDIPMSVVVVHSSARSGLMVENLTPQLGTFFGAKNGEGVLVRSVEKGSAAEKAGFHAGDVIVKVNGETVSDTGDFTHSLRSRKQSSISIGIIRDKKEQTLTLTLPERRQSGELKERILLPQLDDETRAEMEKLRSQMAEIKPDMMKFAEEYRRMQPEVEELNKQVLEQRKQLEEDMKDLQQELRQDQEEMQENMRRSLRSGSADI
jgi:membrane-associated protease RseP (regulator of RpoE activity)